MFTDRPARAEADAGQIVLIGGERYLDVPLYWQHWRLRTAVLDDLADSVRRVAAGVLAGPD